MANDLSAKAREVLENGGFTYNAVASAEAGRDVYDYTRTSRNGRPVKAELVYRLTVIMGRFCASCGCPEGERQRKAGDGVICKHGESLEYWLSSDVPVIVPAQVEPQDLKVVAAPALSGWGLCGL